MNGWRGRLANDLLALLYEHIEVCEAWEDHYIAVADKSYGRTEEKETHTWLRENKTAPFLQRVYRSPFTYAEVIEIIPPAFETTTKQRAKIYEDLVNWVGGIYGV